MATCSVDKWRNRQGGIWYPSSGLASVGSSTGATQYVASNPSGTNKYTIVLRIKTPNDEGIDTIDSISVSFSMYKGNTTSGTLYGSLRTTYDDLGSGDTASTFRTNAIGDEDSQSYASTSYGTFSFTFYGDFEKNTSYYLVLYSKSNNDMFFTAKDKFAPSASCQTSAATYTIAYSANGGSGAPNHQVKEYGETLTLSTITPTKESSSKSTTGSFDITGDANGGYFGIESNTTTVINADYSREEITNYTFSHWNTNMDGIGTTYYPGDSYTDNKSDVLYAIYTSSISIGDAVYNNNSIDALDSPSRDTTTEATYTITFDANGGSCATASLSSSKIRNYSFKGWAETDNATTAIPNNTTYNAAKTVYAVWGSSDATAAITLPTPTKSGYAFMGWATTANAASGTTGSYTPTENITLYAIWSMENSLVHYNDNGNDVLCAVYYNDNGKAVLCNVYYNDNGTAVRI